MLFVIEYFNEINLKEWIVKMTISSNDLLTDLQVRGLISQMTAAEAFKSHLAGGSRTLYCGFDPTADSLHLGHLVPLLVLKRFQDAGHNPIVLVGGATGLIGDPSFKSVERQLNNPDIVVSWTEKICSQVSRFVKLDGVDNSARVVNNLDWVSEMNVLDFLRDIGKHFSVNAMINKESVQQRLNRERSGISFTEFSYALLQGMDFSELNHVYDCTIQIGGSDQWGNIVGGIDLSRRQNKSKTFGMTVPLVVKSDGTKFGKTESGVVWLDSSRTSQYAFYQFWMNTADADVYKFLKFFTFLSLEEINAIEKADRESNGKPQAQLILAREATKLVHGEEGLQAAKRITNALFNDEVDQLSEQDLEQIQLDGLPSSSLQGIDLASTPLTALLVDVGLATSGKQVKDVLQRNSVFVNNQVKNLENNMDTVIIFSKEMGYFGKYFLVKLGKKKYHLFVL